MFQLQTLIFFGEVQSQIVGDGVQVLLQLSQLGALLICWGRLLNQAAVCVKLFLKLLRKGVDLEVTLYDTLVG